MLIGADWRWLALIGADWRCLALVGAGLTASKEARLGHRVSECIVAGRVWGLGGGCLEFSWFGLSCATDCVEGGSFRASHRGVHYLLSTDY